MATSPVEKGTPALDVFLKAFRLKKNSGNSKVNRGHKDSSKLVLSIFDIPPGLLTRSEDARDVGAGSGLVAAGSVVNSATTKRGLTCIRCELTFDDRPAQLAHFKSKLHMTNLRRQLSGEQPLSQEQLAAVDEDDTGRKIGEQAEETSEHSGSDSDAESGRTATGTATIAADADKFDESDIADGLALARAASVEEISETLTRTNSRASTDGEDGNSAAARGSVKVDFSLQEGPRLTFTRSGSAWAFSLSSAALGMERGSDPWERLDGLLVGEEESGVPNRLWAVIIVQSGKFAAAVFEGQSVLCHKVFRRYTIRAKRGGSQSSYDSGGRKAQSAGATLRRYGEQSLREDTRALLKEWQEPLKACRVILTSVPKLMRSLLFEGKDAPFDRKDPRLRPIPFAVGKPVFEEVVAVHNRVTSIIFTEAAAETDDHVMNEVKSKDKVGGKDTGSRDTSSPPLSQSAKGSGNGAEVGGGAEAGVVQQQASCPPSEELIEVCQQGDVSSAVALLDRLTLTDTNLVEGNTGFIETAGAAAPPAPPATSVENGTVPEANTSLGWTVGDIVNRPDGLERLRSPLHVAAEGGHANIIGALLERGASPLTTDVRGRVPYLLTANKETRDAFRRARAALPDRWDWDAARVPEPLTEELEQRQKEKQREKEKEKRRRAKQRKRDEKANAEEEERQRKAKEAAEAEERKARGLAAQGHCDACGNTFIEKKAFRRFEYTYCTTDCANAHKRKLAADAAERRFNGV